MFTGPNLQHSIWADEGPDRRSDLEIHFCKDTFDPSLGAEIFSAITNHLDLIDWGFEQSLRNDHQLAFGKSGASYSGLVAREWTREHDSLRVKQFYSADSKSRLMISMPAAGGTVLLPPNPGNAKFHQGVLHFKTEAGVLEESQDTFVELLKTLFVLLEGSYAFITKSDPYRKVWRLDRQLLGVFWVTALGPDYVSMIGRERILGLPAYDLDWLSDGSVLVRLTGRYEESLTVEGGKIRKLVRKGIGEEWFRPRKDAKWYPQLRNLVLPPQG